MSTAVCTVMCSEPVMRAPVERLGVGVLGPDGHQAGHLVLGELDLLAAERGEGEVGDLEVGRKRMGVSSSRVGASDVGGDARQGWGHLTPGTRQPEKLRNRSGPAAAPGTSGRRTRHAAGGPTVAAPVGARRGRLPRSRSGRQRPQAWQP